MRKHRQDLEVSNAEIARMTRDLDQLHHDAGMPAMFDAVAELTDAVRAGAAKATDRRTFLLGTGGLVAGAGILAAIGSTPALAAAAPSTSLPAASGAKSQGGGLTGDLAIAAVAASVENLAVHAYQSAAKVAGTGKFGTVPPAITTFITTVVGQHRQHAAAWNSLLTAANKKAVTTADPALTPTVNDGLAQAKSLTDVAQLALTLENTAAQTYQAEASKLKSSKAVAVAATIQPVEMQHAAILYYVLGEYPGIQTSSKSPLAFNPTNLAV